MFDAKVLVEKILLLPFSFEDPFGAHLAWGDPLELTLQGGARSLYNGSVHDARDSCSNWSDLL